MYSPETIATGATEKSALPKLDASLSEVKGVKAAQGKLDERDYLDGLLADEAARVAKEEAVLQGQNDAAAEAARQETQNEGLKEMQAEVERLSTELSAMKTERANWDWNHIPALVSALGKMVKGGDAGLVGELEDASKALKLVTDLERAKKQLEFVRTAQVASPTEIKH